MRIWHKYKSLIKTKEAIYYALVGVINTIIGTGLCLMLIFLGFMPELANTLGNVAGIVNSYILNRKFTFKSTNPHKQDFLCFIIAMGIAYMMNLCVLMLTYRVMGLNVYFCQILSSITYTCVGFLVVKFWVFKA